MCPENPAGDDIPTVPEVSRRGFLIRMGIALNATAAALVAVPVVGYLFAGVHRTAKSAWVPLGAVDDFPAGEVRLANYVNPFTVPWDGDTEKIPCWVRRAHAGKGVKAGQSDKDASDFTVFAINCAHLGCPVRWFSESELFMCPCHGGVYYADGSVASGPPPRGLYSYETKIEDKKLWVKGGHTPSLAHPLS